MSTQEILAYSGCILRIVLAGECEIRISYSPVSGDFIYSEKSERLNTDRTVFETFREVKCIISCRKALEELIKYQILTSQHSDDLDGISISIVPSDNDVIPIKGIVFMNMFANELECFMSHLRTILGIVQSMKVVKFEDKRDDMEFADDSEDDDDDNEVPV